MRPKCVDGGDMQVCRVYVGSFNTVPIKTDLNPAGEQLFLQEQADLVKDLKEVPHRSCDRKVFHLPTTPPNTPFNCAIGYLIVKLKAWHHPLMEAEISY